VRVKSSQAKQSSPTTMAESDDARPRNEKVQSSWQGLAERRKLIRHTGSIASLKSFGFTDISIIKAICDAKSKLSVTEVLVVDGARICQIVQRMLSNEQCKVQTSQTVADTLGAIEQKAFDVM
jgi:hypothetical protein